MNFKLNLEDKYFNLIKNKSKTIELRLYDEEKKLININDQITFNNRQTQEKLICTVLKLYKASSFSELAKKINIEKTGFKTLIELEQALLKFYPKEKQEKFGVLGIEIEVA